MGWKILLLNFHSTSYRMPHVSSPWADGLGSDTLGSGVKASPAGLLLAKPEVKGAGCNEPLVSGPHAGHHLANVTKGVLHCLRSNGETIFGKAPIPVPLCKDLKVWGWVCDRCQ
jgi:hypothetical protein